MFVDEAQLAAAEVKQDSEIVRTLKAAKAVIEKPWNWTTGNYCIGPDSNNNPDAGVQFCAVGAIWKALGGVSFSRNSADVEANGAAQLLKLSIPFAGFDHPVQVNDRLGHAAVMQMFDAAIEKAEREGL